MNLKLTEEIVYHVLAGFGVLPSAFIQNSAYLTTNHFLLPEKLTFEQDKQLIKKNIYGCQFKMGENKYVKVILGDCSLDDTLEYAFIINIPDNPSYGLYLAFNKLISIESQPMIAVSVDHKNFMNCDTYLQATFLAGMEKLKEIAVYWEKAASYQEQYKLLLEFINFHNDFFEENDTTDV